MAVSNSVLENDTAIFIALTGSPLGMALPGTLLVSFFYLAEEVGCKDEFVEPFIC